jgi:hypothetical protein
MAHGVEITQGYQWKSALAEWQTGHGIGKHMAQHTAILQPDLNQHDTFTTICKLYAKLITNRQTWSWIHVCRSVELHV